MENGLKDRGKEEEKRGFNNNNNNTKIFSYNLLITKKTYNDAVVQQTSSLFRTNNR